MFRPLRNVRPHWGEIQTKPGVTLVDVNRSRRLFSFVFVLFLQCHVDGQFHGLANGQGPVL